ncbi:Glycosyl hydrolase superfamily protein [Hibiscus syriacus]|uniref:Glycosyl hydrolase superfamily protein n=1 Tax=Hibiscus syriacus TaxID=106335 RepID=A0A6A2ZMQ9_HIBSY|nr:uncharacterized protein LOC120142646 [Hibiscus syriacus]KAE8692757.1 Glycosyl hydrolase superfamily protein [Hibiscus syriacus]
MVVPLGPGKFYGSSLPRPRIYTDTKFSSERIDPPVPVLDPLLSWADDAHWSMGGRSFKRLRLQGRIEGNVKRLKAQREKILNDTPERSSKTKIDAYDDVSPPPAPMAVKRRFLDLNDDDNALSGSEVDEPLLKREKKRVLRNGAVRKLGNDFELAAKNGGLVSEMNISFSDGIGGDVMRIVEEVNHWPETKDDKKKTKGKTEVTSGSRTSPRLAKRGRN